MLNKHKSKMSSDLLGGGYAILGTVSNKLKIAQIEYSDFKGFKKNSQNIPNKIMNIDLVLIGVSKARSNVDN